MDYDEQWWTRNGSKVKRRLTLAEGNVRTQPSWAAAEGRRVMLLFEERGYPDWWSRCVRLIQDAELYEQF